MAGKLALGSVPNRPLSPAMRAGDFVYVSGQVPSGTGGIETQVREVLDNVQAALALAGAHMDQVVKTTCYLRHAADFAAFNAAYAAYFPKAPPARTTVEARLMADILVEIDAIAFAPYV